MILSSFLKNINHFFIMAEKRRKCGNEYANSAKSAKRLKRANVIAEFYKYQGAAAMMIQASLRPWLVRRSWVKGLAAVVIQKRARGRHLRRSMYIGLYPRGCIRGQTRKWLKNLLKTNHRSLALFFSGFTDMYLFFDERGDVKDVERETRYLRYTDGRCVQDIEEEIFHYTRIFGSQHDVNCVIDDLYERRC